MVVTGAAILVEDLSKKFNRSLAGAAWIGLKDGLRRGLRLQARDDLAPGEFWALRDLSFRVERGECLGIIGPNGAGKTTLLKLINRDLRPNRGRIVTAAPATALIRIGSGLQPLLSGRENVYIQCAQLGLSKPQTDAQIERIIEFAGLKDAIDAPVKTYSDGMYARLEFAAATCVPMDLLLIDEVLAVGDIAFQLRCLEHINELKRAGTAVVFVSHSEMNIRQVADRCLLLFDGHQLALGEPDRLFAHYYTAVGYRNRQLAAAGGGVTLPEDRAEGIAITDLLRIGGEGAVKVGGTLKLELSYRADRLLDGLTVVLHFWTAGGLLLASVDSACGGQAVTASGSGLLRLQLPFVGLAPGLYRIAAGLRQGERLLVYRANLLEVAVTDGGQAEPAGLATLPVVVEAVEGR
ncbi:MAG: ATP-binding cassette domain-containing protein [Methylococcaceae bacterium]|nr:ATP-binding cassette domain-containing protein [Methylococcaceae bacterium]